MSNFKDPKPYIGGKNSLPLIDKKIDRKEAIKKAVEIIRENKRIVESACPTHENSYR